MTLALAALLLAAAPLAGAEPPGSGSVVFLHPDGTGLAHWNAARMLLAGPDGTLHWDRLPAVGLYRGHLRDALASTSNGGGTVHAFGVKAGARDVGANGGRPLVSASGRPVSLMREALAAGLGAGIVSTASVTDAGTAVFLASVERRGDHLEIARQMSEARPDVLLGGGEAFFLPEGTAGRHGPGRRTDGRNLVEEMREAGYRVVTTREELLALPPETTRLLGLFAQADTFASEPEEVLRAAGRSAFDPAAPTYAQMLRAALTVLSRSPRRFLLVAEEEATDNLGNANNAPATLQALARADEGIGVALEHLGRHPETLVLTAADSDAGGLEVVAGTPDAMPPDRPLPPREANGAPLDGREGTGSPPFLAAPDRAGRRLPFGIAWATDRDTAGGIVARAAGLGRERVGASFDNTDVYRAMYQVLFGREP